MDDGAGWGADADVAANREAHAAADKGEPSRDPKAHCAIQSPTRRPPPDEARKAVRTNGSNPQHVTEPSADSPRQKGDQQERQLGSSQPARQAAPEKEQRRKNRDDAARLRRPDALNGALSA